MSISASMVKELREKTSAGMMDCKKALEETQGDFEAAVEWLRKKGLSAAAKKAGRVTAEGAVFAQVQNNVGIVVEINSETDFVARNDGFRAFVKNIADHIVAVKSMENLLDQVYHKNNSQKISDLLKENIATIGENLVIRRSEKYEGTANSLVHTYVHGEGKIGVLLEMTGDPKSQEVRNYAQDVALHIAAMNPMAISGDQLPASVVAKEKEILKAKALEQGKKPEMLDKIVEGQIRKFMAESCLLDQAFVKNPDIKVADHLKAGGGLQVKRFVRFELGEGIEKRKDDFAAEVAAQQAAAMKGH
jgi:elongation factor Ts